MSSIGCQGLIKPCALGNKLDPPKSNFPQTFQNHQEECQQNSHNEEENENKNNGFPEGDLKSIKNGGLVGWSFVQALTTKSQNFQEPTENEKVYVHPLVKRSSSTLCKKSLEMCTESLGSETGSDISESSDEFSSLSRESDKPPPVHQPSKTRECFAKKPTRSGSGDFPPPLASISGSESVQVSVHREGGRLVLKAFTVASSKAYFQAERVNGRLRLSLLENSSLNCDNGVIVDDDDVDDDDGDVVDDDDEDVGHDDDDDGTWVEDMGGNSGNVGCEMEFGELPRRSRCKEGGGGSKGISSWKPCLKALC